MNLTNVVIKTIEFSQSPFMIACGPVEGELHACIKFADGDKKEHFLILNEFEGTPAFALTDEDKFDYIVEGETNEKYFKYRKSIAIDELGSLKLGDTYEELFENMYSQHLEDTEEGKLIRLIVNVMRFDFDKMNKLIKNVSNKSISEIDIEKSDVESEYFENKKL